MLTYPIYLALSGAIFVLLERLWPRYPGQKLFRRGLLWDLALLLFHSEIGGWLVAVALASFIPRESLLPYRLTWLGTAPLWLEILALWIVKDFVQWLVHNLFHRVPWLWRIHRLHHTTEEMDWLSNWRFHPVETLVYQTFLYLPALALGFRPEAALLCAFLSTGMSHFAHANLRWHFGPLKYIFNTPELHIWHHVHPDAGPQNRNFCVSFAIWDWMFGTAYCPSHAPTRLGVND